VNLSDQYKFDIYGNQVFGGNWRQLYWISPDGFRRLDVGSRRPFRGAANKVIGLLQLDR